jgi:hypothetical protein
MMRTAKLVLPVVAMVAAMPLALCAQTYSRTGIGVGTRVRVTTPGVPGRDRYAGRVVAVGADTLTLHRDHAQAPSALAFSTITKLEVSRGRHPDGWRGAWVGLFGGAAAGTVVGLVTHKPGHGKCYFLAGCDPDYRAEKGIRPGSGAAMGAIAGLLIGPLVGRRIHSERWVTR